MKSILIAVIAFSLIAKVLIHAHLNKKHGNQSETLGPPGMTSVSYFLPYMNDVQPLYEREKRVCNLLYVILVVSIALTILHSLLTGTKLS